MASQSDIVDAENKIIAGQTGAVQALSLLKAERTDRDRYVRDNYNHWKTVQLNAEALRRDVEKLLMELVKTVGPIHRDVPMPWCDACNSYHVTPTSEDHHRKLQCKAPFGEKR